MTPENSSTEREAPRRSRMANNLPPLKQRMGPSAAEDGAAARVVTPAVAVPAAKKRMGAPSNPIAVPAPESAPLPASAPAPTGAGMAPSAGGRKRMSPGAPAAGAAPAPAVIPSASAPDARPSGDIAAGSLSDKRPAWRRRAAVLGGLIVAAVVVVMAARWLNDLVGVREFITTYDGSAPQPDAAPVGIPAWMGWQHFLNIFFMVLIVRTGLQIRTERKPPAYWTAKRGSFFSPKGNTPKKVSLTQWLHQALDVFWVLNGLVFIILLSVTGQWMRIVPTSWDIFPNMLSAAIQYASLDWPTENGWVHYNALQVMAYFITVFIAAPLAVVSGIRMSTWWPENARRLNKAYPVEWARAIHIPVMVYFLAFTLVHVFLVFFTGALRNLNHMYTSRDAADWWGLAIFLASLLVIAGAWLLARPIFITPAAARTGKISK